MQVINKLKEHYLIIIIAFAFGLFCSLPQYLATRNVPNFRGIYNLSVDDYSYYETRVRDVVDGHVFLSNPYFYEHKDGFPMQTWLTDYIVAKPIQWFNLSIPVGFMIWDGVIVFFLFILTYFIFYETTKDKKWSILGVIFLYVFMFGDMYIEVLGFKKNIALFGDFYLRLPSPAFNFLFWHGLALSIILYIKNGSKIYLYLSVLLFGLMFYVYPYYWTFYFVLLCIFTVFTYLFKTKEVNYRYIIYIFVGGLFIAIPYFIFNWMSSETLYYDESLKRLGLIHTHVPSGIRSVILAGITSVIFLWMYYKKKILPDAINLFLISGVLTTAIVVNQHVITGKNLEFVNHYFLQNTFWILFSLMYLFIRYTRTVTIKTNKILFIVSLIIIVWGSYYSLIEISKKQHHYYETEIYKQNYSTIFEWLNNNAKKDEVVFANDSISDLITVYTSQNVYSSPFGILFFLSDEEVEKRYLINHYFDEFTDQYIILNHRKMLGGYYVNEYGRINSLNKIRSILGIQKLKNDLFPSDKIDYLREEHRKVKKLKLDEIITTYKADYVIWDKIKDPKWRIDKYKKFKPVYENNSIEIFRVQ